MSQDDCREKGDPVPLDFSRFVRDYFHGGELVGLKLIDVSQEGTNLQVVFDGVPEIRTGRFGVRIPTPARVGDQRWNEFPVTGDKLEEWASLAIILELVEVYETTAQSAQGKPYDDGVIWLS